MKTSEKETTVLSPLMQTREKRKGVAAKLVGAISKARARQWIRHVSRSRKDWN